MKTMTDEHAAEDLVREDGDDVAAAATLVPVVGLDRLVGQAQARLADNQRRAAVAAARTLEQTPRQPYGAD